MHVKQFVTSDQEETNAPLLGRATHHALRTGPLSARPGYWCEGTFDRVFHGNELLMKMTRQQFNTTTESSLFYYFTILRALALPLIKLQLVRVY